ncbi:MAG: hypothetical protein HYY18_01090 [Planctomycetes bacterium]|nr:hypothetical protein [Planctomycetota bacterium]
MSDSTPSALPGDKSAPCRQYVGCISLADRLTLAPQETRTLQPFAFSLPNLTGSLELMLVMGELRVCLQSGRERSWSELAPGWTPVVVGCTHLAAAPLDGRPTRVVLSNESHLPAIVLSADMRLAADAPPKPEEKPHAE